MARKKSVESIDAEIAKTQSEMTKVQERYNKLAERIEALQEQKLSIPAFMSPQSGHKETAVPDMRKP